MDLQLGGQTGMQLTSLLTSPDRVLAFAFLLLRSSFDSKQQIRSFPDQLSSHLIWAAIPFRRVSEEVAANFGSIWDDWWIMKKRFVPDLHLEELLISGRQLLHPGAEWQQQQDQRAVEQEHPAGMTGIPDWRGLSHALNRSCSRDCSKARTGSSSDLFVHKLSKLPTHVDPTHWFKAAKELSTVFCEPLVAEGN